MGMSISSNSIILEIPEKPDSVTVYMGNSFLHGLVHQSDTSSQKARGVVVTHTPVAENKQELLRSIGLGFTK